MTYPITENNTILSIDKTAKLLQVLVDLAGGEGGTNLKQKLPENIQKRVDKVLNAQKQLVKEIDVYMHSQHREVDEIEVVSSIIETCPEFLATRSNDQVKSLPIVFFACSVNEEAVRKYVPLLAEVGRKHGVGGEGARGGLLVKNKRGFNALEALAAQKSSNVMKTLRNADPPLLLKDDVRDYNLLHHAARCESIEMVKYMVQLDPSCLYFNQDEYGLPLEQACVYTDQDEVDKKRKKSRLQIAKYLSGFI